MPLFYFHVHEADDSTLDEDGRELPDLEKARHEAIRGVRSILGAEVSAGRLDLRGRMEVADEAGMTLFIILFSDTIDIQPELCSCSRAKL